MLHQYGFGCVWLSQDVGNESLFLSTFKNRLEDCMKRNWHDQINTPSRWCTYKHHKTLLNTKV